MTEPRGEHALQELLAQVRGLRPPVGARERVLARSEQALEARRRAAPARFALAGLALAGAVAGALWLVPRAQAPAAGRVLAASAASTEHGALRSGDPLAEGAIVVAERGRLQMALARAEVGLVGPARVELERGALVVHEGGAFVDGTLKVRGGDCSALVHGRCALARAARALQITLFAGSVELAGGVTACSVIDLTAGSAARTAGEPPARAPAAALPDTREPDPAARSAVHHEREARARAPGPSELALQVAAYREALELRGRDDARAVERWREMTRRWPRSPLRHEIDLNVIDALVRLGRGDEARSEARRFLDRHPHSSKAGPLRSMLGD